MSINIDPTTVVSSGIVAMIIGCFQLIGTRYTNRILDHIEKSLHAKNGKKE